MRHSTSILGAALVISALLNIVLLTRGRAEPAPPPAPKPAARSEGMSTSPVAEELARERALTRELRDTVKRLEEEKSVLAQAATTPGVPAPAPAAAAPKLSLKDKLRKMKKLFKSAEEGVQPDQEAVLEMSGEIMEVMRMSLTRGKDPRAYADFLEACTEVSLEDEAALTPDQRTQLSSVLKDMADELGRIQAGSAAERLVRELEIESSAMDRVKGLLTPAQADLRAKQGVEDLASMNVNTSYVQKGNAQDMIVKAWTQAYKLTPEQQPAARAAAESYARELESLGVKGVDMGNYSTRLNSLRAQVNALKTLEGALAAEQRDRLRDQAPREFLLLDAQFAPPAAAPEK